MRRFHPLQRAGWYTSRTSTTATQTVIAIGLFVVGSVLKRSTGRQLLYGTTLKPGESVRIRVMDGDRLLADTRVEH